MFSKKIDDRVEKSNPEGLTTSKSNIIRKSLVILGYTRLCFFNDDKEIILKALKYKKAGLFNL